MPSVPTNSAGTASAIAGDPTSKLAQNIKVVVLRKWQVITGTLTDNMPILEHVSRAGAIPAKGEPLLRTA